MSMSSYLLKKNEQMSPSGHITIVMSASGQEQLTLVIHVMGADAARQQKSGEGVC